jgi:hypothetical protein
MLSGMSTCSFPVNSLISSDCDSFYVVQLPTCLSVVWSLLLKLTFTLFSLPIACELLALSNLNFFVGN